MRQGTGTKRWRWIWIDRYVFNFIFTRSSLGFRILIILLIFSSLLFIFLFISFHFLFILNFLHSPLSADIAHAFRSSHIALSGTTLDHLPGAT